MTTARPVAIRQALHATAAASMVSVTGARGIRAREFRESAIPAWASSSRRRSRPAAVCLLCARGAPARTQNASSGWTS